MIKFRSSAKRMVTDHGWLKSLHTFSFGKYIDLDNLGFGTLRVLNEDILAPARSYGEQFHKDLELLTYVMQGAIEHRDNLGNSSVIQAGEVQRVTSGSGILESKRNLSSHLPAHLFQIWVQSSQNNLTPSVEQKFFTSASKWGQWCLLASNNGRAGSLTLHQDLDLYAIILDQGDETEFDALTDRRYWLQVVSGSFLLNNQLLSTGDSASLIEESTLLLQCQEGGQCLLFDLA